MKKLPIGIQSIEKILGKGNYVYVDKTSFALQLIEGDAPHHFFSRPRRFGKSLFVSTLKEIFLGNKELFKGCAIYDSNYDWPVYPVLSFNFARIANETRSTLDDGIQEALEDIAELYQVAIKGSSLQSRLGRLVTALAKQAPVVVLVDEYDKPLIDHIHHPGAADENRKLLQGFFGTLKNLEDSIHFTFVTGIAKFSKVSLFSEANHLKDITMMPKYAGMMGYTEQELVHYFDEHVQVIAQERNAQGQPTIEEDVLAEIKEWYNGYRFSKADTQVYNPFSTLNFLDERTPQSYWYDSGTPAFLIEQVKKHPEAAVPLAGTTAEESTLMSISSLEDIDLKALMFQTGYLTIKGYSAMSKHYQLDFPNEEVREAFTKSLVRQFAQIDTKLSSKMEEALEQYELTQFFNQVQVTLASFPYQLFSKVQERTYHGMLLSLMSGMGLEVSAERPSNLGRVDLLVELPTKTYVMEVKLDSSAEAALAQIREKQYHVPHLRKGKEVAIVGLNFSSETRNLAGWRGELLSEYGKLVHKLRPEQDQVEDD
ncbi:MAG: AAA family ATPase [Roseivirga sp.]